MMRLSANGLCSKFGFSDGDIVDYVCEQHGVDLKGRYHKDVLITLVRKYLEPKLSPGISLFEISTTHNPIRCTDECWDMCNDDDSFVTITKKQLLAAIEETKVDESDD